jgi:tRNA modification GTPase
VADLIDASTEAAARSAARSLDGAFSREIGLLAEKIVELRLLVEATLDFPEEEIEFLERAGARRRLAEAKAQIAAVLATARQGALLNEGMRVVLAGQPNVGKSSLLNALAGAELAIVTDIPGTTRDKVGETIQIEGVPVHVTDTAGLREAGDAVEAIGVARSWSAIGEADAVVWLRDLTRIGEVGLRRRRGDASTSGWRPRSPRPHPRGLQQGRRRSAAADRGAGTDALVVSAVTGAGLDRLRAALLAAPAGRPPARASFTPAPAMSMPCSVPACISTRPRPMPKPATRRSSSSPRSCARRTTPSARSPAPSPQTTCWGDLQSFLYRQVSRTRPSSAGGAGQGAAICDRVALLARAHHR